MKLAHYQWQSYAQIDKIFRISRMSVYSRLKGHIEAKKKIVIRWQLNQLPPPLERLRALGWPHFSATVNIAALSPN